MFIPCFFSVKSKVAFQFFSLFCSIISFFLSLFILSVEPEQSSLQMTLGNLSECTFNSFFTAVSLPLHLHDDLLVTIDHLLNVTLTVPPVCVYFAVFNKDT